ncbi:MAG: hypothetical protein MZW92_41820 [Comamonadaceae bacterium]|nr:hypothetical protein [Comamonadaceae bacterium]
MVKTLQAIADANVVRAAARRDAGRDATRTRTSPATSSKSGRAVVVAVNKWDAIDDYQRQHAASARSSSGWRS